MVRSTTSVFLTKSWQRIPRIIRWERMWKTSYDIIVITATSIVTCCSKTKNGLTVCCLLAPVVLRYVRAPTLVRAFLPFDALLTLVVQLLQSILATSPPPAPCGLRGCKNGPDPFPGRMSYKATKPGQAVCHILACFLLCCCLLGPLLYIFSFHCMCSVFWLF